MKISLKKQLSKFISLVLAVFLTITAVPFAYSQTNSTSGNPVDGTPVVLGDDQIFVIQERVGSFSAAERLPKGQTPKAYRKQLTLDCKR